MVYCCVPLCNSKYDKGNETSFHEFPSDPTLRRTWLNFISREGEKKSTCWLPNDKSVVCSNHFQGKDYKPGLKRRILNQGAVPTVFCDYPPHKKVKQDKLRQPIKKLQVSVSKPNIIAAPTSSTSVDNDASAKMDACIGLKRRIGNKPNILAATTSSTSVDNDATAKMDACIGLKRRIGNKPHIIAATTSSTSVDKDDTGKMDAWVGLNGRIVSHANIAATTRSTSVDNDATGKVDPRIGLKVRIVSKTNIAATTSSTFVDNDGTGKMDSCVRLKGRILNKNQGAVPTVVCEDPFYKKVKQVKLSWPMKFQVPVIKMNIAATTNSTSVNNDGTAKTEACVGTLTTMSNIENSIKKFRTVQRQCLRYRNKCAQYNVSLRKLRAKNKLLKQKIEKFNMDAIEKACESGDSKANFLREQLLVFSKQKMREWSDNTIQQCVLWNSKSPNAYRFAKTLNILTLPGRSTLRRYIRSVLGNKTSLIIEKKA